jgi:high-affinity iron transporter
VCAAGIRGAAAVGVLCAVAMSGCGSERASGALSGAEVNYSRAIIAARGPTGSLSGERLVPVSLFVAPIAGYRRYAEAEATSLRPEVGDIDGALRAGRRVAAEAAWRVAFARYLSLGAVYGEFGALDAAIDGEPGGLPGGVRDTDFAGFHRLEYGLWTGQSLGSLLPTAVRLAADVRLLIRLLPSVVLAPADYVTRGHEILEDAQRDFLSGLAVPWSGEGVLATQAALTATRVVVDTLQPVIGRYLRAALAARLATVQSAIDAVRGPSGALPTIQALGAAQRERLDGAVSGALEILQELPDYATTAPPPTPALPTP